MAKGQYTRGRLILLQVIMWVIFGITMGMAAFVTAHHRSALQVELSPPVKLGIAELRLPAGWKVSGPSRRGALQVIEAVEPRTQVKGSMQRVFTVFYEPLTEDVAPHVYLLSQPEVGYEDNSWLGEGSGTARDPEEFEHIRLGGYDAVQTERIVRKRVMLKYFPPNAEFFVAAVVPGKGAVTVRYSCDPGASAADRALFAQVLREITLSKN